MSLTESSPVEAARLASVASRELATLSSTARNDALTTLHAALQNNRDSILEANARDLQLASSATANGELSQSVFKRLDLGRPGKFDDMLKGVLDVRDLEDPGLCTVIPG
jgi:glutamate-5-semialdehyde dehydrogenase